jgi:O-succinylbenzoic acid--CoA ligase
VNRPSLQTLDVPAGPEVLEVVLPALRAALDDGPAILPVPPLPDPRRAAVVAAAQPDVSLEVDDVAVVLATGGSTGAPKCALLTRTALSAAAARQDERLGGPGLWVLALPAWHAGGLQVLVRALSGGIPPVALDLSRTFDADAFDDVTRRGREQATALGVPLYVSLVPTQLSRLPASSLLPYDGVLVGSAAAPPGMLDRLRRDGVRLLESYGMSETCGGYAYDGIPIRDVAVTLRPGDERVTIGGPTLFSGYRLRPDLTAESLVDGRLVTADVGRFVDGRLELLGRADDVIVTGGEKVAPSAVVDVLLGQPGVAAAVVLGVPDREWGQAVVAYVVPVDSRAAPNIDALRSAVGDAVGRHGVPKRVHVLDVLPTQASGKLNRAALVALDESYPGVV